MCNSRKEAGKGNGKDTDDNASSEIAFPSRTEGTGVKTKLKGNDRRKGVNKKRPFRVVTEKDGGEAQHEVFEPGRVEDKSVDIALESPMNFDLEPLPPEFKFQEPYKDAKYSILVPVDFSDRSQVPLDTEHPHMRFVGREVRRDFPYTDPRTKKKVMKEFRGVVSHFSANRSLFRVDYEDGDSQDVDYEELMQMLVPLDSEHPNFRFVGREVRKEFNTVDARKRKVMRAFKGKVKSYSPSSSLFEIVYSDGDCEDLDLDELMQVLIMGKKY